MLGAMKQFTGTLWISLLGMLLLFVSVEPPVEPVKIGVFNNSVDLGELQAKGQSVYNASGQTYTLRGTGTGISAGSDEAHFLWKAIQGDFILRAEVDPALEPDEGVSFGWSVRNNISAEAAMVSAVVISGEQAAMMARTEKREAAGVPGVADHVPDVIQIERINDVFRMKTARFGEALSTVAEMESPLGNEVLAGLFVSSGSSVSTAELTFRNVRIVKPFPENEPRNQRYLGSRMEILNVETGMRKILFESEHSIQAPNWTPDNKKLIYNSNGYLYTYEIETGQITHLNTGFATNNNNDHVITFDGEQIAISHHVPEDNYQSTIYIMPVEGSEHPRQVTRTGAGHAYLHGISPDNQTVIFTGWRNDKFDIYAADVETMQETRLTDTPTLDDGSEYSPDGKHIWFNSNRTGTMEIWRMNADGSEETQITHDEHFHDWFPHISPDGKNVLFLSYGLDVDSGDHPFYRQVTLRMMPAAGGKPEIVAYLYGGQGTINVPSWSPDSKYVAFVSNSGRFY